MNIPSAEAIQEIYLSPRVYKKGLAKEAEELKNEIYIQLRNSIRLVETNAKSHHRNAHSASRLVALDRHKGWSKKNWPEILH